MSETRPERQKFDPENPNQESQDSYLPITQTDLAKLASQRKLQGPVLATITLINVGAMEVQGLHKQLREISNEGTTTCIRQFLNWIINLPESEWPTWLRWINDNTVPKTRNKQLFSTFMSQVKDQFKLGKPDIIALIALFTEYSSKKRGYNREIQTALKKYLDQYDLDSIANTQK